MCPGQAGCGREARALHKPTWLFQPAWGLRVSQCLQPQCKTLEQLKILNTFFLGSECHLIELLINDFKSWWLLVALSLPAPWSPSNCRHFLVISAFVPLLVAVDHAAVDQHVWTATHFQQSDEWLTIICSEFPRVTTFIRLTCELGKKYPAHTHRTESLLGVGKTLGFLEHDCLSGRSTQSWSLSFPCTVRLRGR